MNKLGIYIHVPFCMRKCAYCDFYSLPDISHENGYCEAAVKQIKCLSYLCKDRIIDTVFIGGGTPTFLADSYLIKIISALKEYFNVSENAEFTIEANPATVSEAQLYKLRSFGVNRISFGCQSAVDDELAELSRLHTFSGFLESYMLARKCGFENTNVDLMYAIPLQTSDSLKYSIKTVASLTPEHISLYGLKIEQGTAFYRNREKLKLPDEDEEREMYLSSVSLLKSLGYFQYEISNFAKPGYESKHNLKYWKDEEYIGIGPAAHSYFNCVRFDVKSDIYSYINTVDFIPHSGSVYENFIPISDTEQINEKIMLGLRLTQGVDFSFLNTEKKEKLRILFSRYEKLGLIKHSCDTISLTPEGMLVSNFIISDILLEID